MGSCDPNLCGFAFLGSSLVGLGVCSLTPPILNFGTHSLDWQPLLWGLHSEGLHFAGLQSHSTNFGSRDPLSGLGVYTLVSLTPAALISEPTHWIGGLHFRGPTVSHHQLWVSEPTPWIGGLHSCGLHYGGLHSRTGCRVRFV